MIELVNGNFFDYEVDVRVNTVNCVGVMGAGVALQFKNRYPRMYEDYIKECSLGKVKIGKPHVWIGSDIFTYTPIIINFPTKDDWKNPSEYEYVEKGLVWLKEYLKDKGRVKVTLPALGCGHGGLDWNIVREMIIRYLGVLEAQIFLFEPASSSSADPVEVSERLKTMGIQKLQPHTFNYPSEIVGKSASDIYLKGNSNGLSNKLFSIFVDPKASEREKTAIENCIESMPTGNFNYLLSYNSSMEIDLVKSILSRNNNAIIIIPYGILNFKIRKDILPYWDENKVTILSISKPTQSWSAYESIKALKFRIRLSDITLLTNFETIGLTKFEKEFKESKAVKFYLNYWSEKNDFYKKIMATPIGRDKSTQKPKMSILSDIIN